MFNASKVMDKEIKSFHKILKSMPTQDKKPEVIDELMKDHIYHNDVNGELHCYVKLHDALSQISQAEQRGYDKAIDQAVSLANKMDLRCEECVGTGQNNKAAWDYGKDIDCQYCNGTGINPEKTNLVAKLSTLKTSDRSEE